MDVLKIGIVIADGDEFAPFENKANALGAKNTEIAGRRAIRFILSGNAKRAEITAVLSGIGKVNAAVCATALAQQGVHTILNCGLSGGISMVSRNDLCIPDRFIEHDFDLRCLGYAFAQKPSQEYIYSADKELMDIALSVIPGAKIGMAVTGDCFVQSDVLRNILKNEFNAVCCDMETAAIAYVCTAYKIKFLSLRKISDDAGDDASADYREINAKAEDDLLNYLLAIIKKMI